MILLATGSLRTTHIIASHEMNISGLVETLIEQYAKKEEDFCDSLNNSTSRTSRSSCYTSGATQTPQQVLQQAQDDDKRWKDAADAEAISDFNARMSQYKTAAIVASRLPGLTTRPDTTRPQQEASAQAGPQFAAQQFMCQPPLFPNPPPPMQPHLLPLQLQQAAQTAAGYPMRMSQMANYQGIPKLKVPIFDREPSEYQRFKLTLNAAYDDNRNLPQKQLALLLEMSLKGRPLTIISDYIRTCIDDLLCTGMWKLLD